MKIADVLRKMADAIEKQENPGSPDEKIVNPAALEPIKGGIAISNPDNVDRTDDEVMIPPLQLKMELLKRAVGVDNVYDPGKPREDDAHGGADDEIQHIRRMAGVPVAAVMELSNDELLDD
jgi:hypothetical protein